MEYSGFKVKEFRLKGGLSVPELSKVSGVNSKEIYRIETGKKFRAETMRKLSKALNRGYEEFIVETK